MAVDISEILDFLPCETPNEWVDAALAHPEELLRRGILQPSDRGIQCLLHNSPANHAH